MKKGGFFIIVKENYLKIILDNGQDLKISVINNKKINMFARQICKYVL